MTEPAASRDRKRHIYVTLSGLPLHIELNWPFHQSGSGADFWVLHGDVQLANSDGLHAPVAVNLSATVREVLPSLEAGEVEGPVINALRKEVDRRQLEFLKSGKLVPVQFSSRYYDLNVIAGSSAGRAMRRSRNFWRARFFGKAGCWAEMPGSPTPPKRSMWKERWRTSRA